MQHFQARVLENDMVPQGFNSTDKGTLTVDESGINWVGTNSTFNLGRRFIQKIRADYNSDELKLCLDDSVDCKCVVFAFDDVIQRDFCVHELHRFKNSKRSAKKKRKKKSILSIQQKKQKKNDLIRVFSTDNWVNHQNEDIWRYEICQTFLNVVEFAEMRATNKTINGYWRVFISKFMRKAVIRVQKDIPRLPQALALANAMWVPYYDKDGKIVPLKIELCEGVHCCEGSELPSQQYDRYTKLNRSHITIVGKGEKLTKICGAFFINNQKGIKIESLTLTNPKGCGLFAIGEETVVHVSHCDIEDCKFSGMQLSNGPVVIVKQCSFAGNGISGLRVFNATLAADHCDFAENCEYGIHCGGEDTRVDLDNCGMCDNHIDGLWAEKNADVNIHGSDSLIADNHRCGILASGNAQVTIHLHWEHNTTYGNSEINQAEESGTITYAGVSD
jgi:hypothetical protein